MKTRLVLVSLVLGLGPLFTGLALTGHAAPPPPASPGAATADDAAPPSAPVKLIFIHHSTGGLWLADTYGQLGLELMDNNYFVSDTNYGWRTLGDNTDIGHWYDWFGSGRNATELAALYAESNQNNGGFGDYSRLAADPGGENEIIVFKSCFPNSALQGSPADAVPAIDSNPLRGQDASSPAHTVANAKGIYIDLLSYFQTRPDKLFIVITAPPLSDGTYAANARAFNTWLMNDWLAGYPLKNAAVFDFYNVLTTNGGDPDTNDLNQATGNHHRWWNNAVQHQTDAGLNTLAYFSGDDHPTAAGEVKASQEFVPLLNVFYHRWKNGVTPQPDLSTSSFQASQPTAHTGDTLTYTLRLANSGAATASNTVLTNTLPTGLNYLNGTLAASGGTPVYTAGSVSWSGSLAASEVVTLTYQANVTAMGTQSLANPAAVSAAGLTPFTRTARLIVNAEHLYLPVIVR